MSFTVTEIFKVDAEYEEEFGTVHPCVLATAEIVWRKSGNFFSSIIQDPHQCLKILMQATALVSRKYNACETDIKNPTSYLYSTFKHLVLAEVSRQKRHCELEIAAGRKRIEADDIGEDEKIYQKILVNQLRARMDEWMREVFDLQTLGYQYKDLIPQYGSSENVIRSKYSKNLLKLKNEIQTEMANIEKELNVRI